MRPWWNTTCKIWNKFNVEEEMIEHKLDFDQSLNHPLVTYLLGDPPTHSDPPTALKSSTLIKLEVFTNNAIFWIRK